MRMEMDRWTKAATHNLTCTGKSMDLYDGVQTADGLVRASEQDLDGIRNLAEGHT